MFTFFYLLTTALCIYAAISDWRFLRIPNWVSLAILGLFVPAYMLFPASFLVWWNPLGGALVLFIVTFTMFAAGLLGGGDAKFASSLGLWVGLSNLPLFLMVMAISGGVLSIFALVMQKRFRQNIPEYGWLARLKAGESVLPYGIPIALAAIVTFWLQ